MPTTTLSPMNQVEFEAYWVRAIPEFAQDKVDAGQWAPADALRLSRESYVEQLPQGLATPGNCFFTVREGASQEGIGMLWFAEQERGGKRIAYVYDVAIDAPHQRKGHARRAFAALETEVAQSGLSGIALHVFGHNSGALSLYEKLGYVPTNINMFKPLTGSST